ncbi:MAG TPA: LytTR family DNA-binding domain-containing protein [Bacteroidales bacterium]|nr:LytTR family DNA-binding domain-containing protein [Bacteroidales bacterium]
MKIVIVEDEPYARQELLRLLKNTGRDFELLKTTDSVEESIEWFSSNSHPDLVFLDIQLADGKSFDIFREVSLRSAVIFTTAYDDYAIKAFELNSIDYLLKPIKQEALNASLEKFDRMRKDISAGASEWSDEQLKKILSLVPGKQYKSRFISRLGEQIKSIGIEEIAYFKAEDKLTFIIDRNGRRYIVDHTLEELESMLDPEKFFRLNRTYYSAYRSITKVSKYFNNRLLIDLEPRDDEKVLVSRARVKDFMDWLDR